MRLAFLLAASAIAACSPQRAEAPLNDSDGRTEDPLTGDPTPPVEPPVRPAVTTAPAEPAGFARELTLAEWRKADNRATCSPLVLLSDGGEAGRARRADFSGGWAVAFDQPGRRSAYGVAGTGVDAKRDDALRAQWPYVRPIGERAGRLPAGAIAGYGLEGARPYADDNSSGRGEQSLAYVTIPGQRCLYNVWSKLGRAHLETLLDQLSLVDAR